MLYKDFHGLKLSALGLGAMRLPTIDGDDARIDIEMARQMVAYAMEHGINYYDTAWGYHGGESEKVIGKILSAYPRDSYYLATKFPGYDVANLEHVAEVFERQLEKTGAGYFDFYLLHNVCEANIEGYLDPRYGVMDYLLKQREAGRIKHLGFSAHGEIPVMERFLEAYGSELEFCQIQLNYLDWTYQDAKGKVELLRRYGLPVWVMEPVRGGRLANLDDDAASKLRAVDSQGTPASWAFRFVQGIPEVCVTLSGMSNFAQLEENIKLFSEERPLSAAEHAVLDEVVEDMLSKNTVPCTACHYCTSHCPQALDIPALLSAYNDRSVSGRVPISQSAVSEFPEDKRPDACIGCGSCAAVCPQKIDIPGVLADFAARLA